MPKRAATPKSTVSKKEAQELLNRLRRIEGQIGGLINMIESERDCLDVVTQISATKKALERAGMVMLARALTECAGDSKKTGEQRREQLQRAFLSLA
jgi:DNA-binding FrmR family transcriptional regulator